VHHALLLRRNSVLVVVDAGLELRSPGIDVGDESGDWSLDVDDRVLHMC
jgi:hypothetical protein